MKNAKKVLAILLALVMMLSLFAACGNDVRPVSAPENTSEEVSAPEAEGDKVEEGEGVKRRWQIPSPKYLQKMTKN